MWLAWRRHGNLRVDPIGGREAEKGRARMGYEKVVAGCVADDGADDWDGTEASTTRTLFIDDNVG